MVYKLDNILTSNFYEIYRQKGSPHNMKLLASILILYYPLLIVARAQKVKVNRQLTCY